MTLGQSLLRKSMHAVARQILRQANHGQVKFRPLVDCDQPVLDEFLTRGQLGVLAFPKRSVVIHTREQPRQNIEQSDVQFARQLSVRQFEETSRQWRRICIYVGRKSERDRAASRLTKIPKSPA